MQIGAIVFKMWTIKCSSLVWFRKWKTVVGLLTLSVGGATLCYKFDQCRVNGCVQNKLVLKCANIMHTGSGIVKMWSQT